MITCRSSGHTHECREHRCDRLEEGYDGLICELTGAVYPRTFASDCPEDATNAAHGASDGYYGGEGDDTGNETKEYKQRDEKTRDEILTLKYAGCDQKTRKLIEKMKSVDPDELDGIRTNEDAWDSKKPDEIPQCIRIQLPVKQEHAETESMAIAPEAIKKERKTRKNKRKDPVVVHRSPDEVLWEAMTVVKCVFKPNFDDNSNPYEIEDEKRKDKKKRKIRDTTSDDDDDDEKKNAPTTDQMKFMAQSCVNAWQMVTRASGYQAKCVNSKCASYPFDYHVLVVLTRMTTGFTIKRDEGEDGEDIVVVPQCPVVKRLLHKRKDIMDANEGKWNSKKVTTAEKLFREFIRQLDL